MSPKKPPRFDKKTKPGSPEVEGGSGFVFRDRSGKVHLPKGKKPEHSPRSSEAEVVPGLGFRGIKGIERAAARREIPLPDSTELRPRPRREEKREEKGSKGKGRRAFAPAPFGNERHSSEDSDDAPGIVIRPGIRPGVRPEKNAKGPWREDRPAPRDDRGPGRFNREDRGAKPSGDRGAFGKRGREDRGAFGKQDRSFKKPGGKDRFEGGSADKGRRFGGGGPGGRGGQRPGGKGRDSAKPRVRFEGLKKFKGTIDKNRKGFGFLIFADRKQEDAFIPPREADTFFHGDRVEATMNDRGEIQSIEVLEHRFREVVGRYFPDENPRSKSGWVIYERKRAREEIYIPDGAPDGALEGNWVRASLEFTSEGRHRVIGKILEVYGDELPPIADVGMIAAEYNLIEEHPPEAEEEAKSFKLDLDLTHRKDLRSVPFITIDGARARDFDDAVYVEKKSGGFTLWVAIADVSHYVVPGTALDADARSRATSVYFPERAFHMLPRSLSENLCSLRPNEPRLTMVAKMEFDVEGVITGTELMEGLIESKRRATYEEIQEEWEKNRENRSWEFAPHFQLYQLLRKMRSKRGSVDFDLPESEVLVKPTGEVEDIRLRDRLDAHRLIEEFMIAANESVTEWALERGWPFIYRVHDEPAEDAICKFQKLASNMGVLLDLDPEAGDLPQRLNSLITQLEGHPAQTLLNMALLRSMKQAVYTSLHGIHFGLASRAYTHFTSPIRRYPDLIVHRMLRMALRTEQGKRPPLDDAGRRRLEDELEESAEHCSYRERLASDAERDSIKLKQVRVMIPHLGEEYEGKIMGMLESGMFVAINHPYVEGMISLENMNEDHFQFNEERMTVQGYRTRRTFRIGDKVKIRVARADVESRQLDFEFLEGPLGSPVNYGGPDPEDDGGDRNAGRKERGGRSDRGDRGNREARGDRAKPSGGRGGNRDGGKRGSRSSGGQSPGGGDASKDRSGRKPRGREKKKKR